MQPTDKFRTDLDQAARRAGGRGEAAEIEALRSFFFRSFPKDRRRDQGLPLRDLPRAPPLFPRDGLRLARRRRQRPHDGLRRHAPSRRPTGRTSREAVVLEEEDLDMELLEYVMSLVLDHGAL